MESLNHNSSMRSSPEEDSNISTFRRRSKILIILFLFLIISLTIIILALILELLRLHNTSLNPVVIPPIEEFCFLSDNDLCLQTLNPIITNRFISDPNQIFIISLQTAAKDLQHIISSNLSDSDSTEFALNNCVNSLRHGFDQIRDPLEKIRVNPFVEWLSEEERGEIIKRIKEAGEDVMSCMDDLAKVEPAAVGAVAAKLIQVKVCLNAAGDYLSGYARILHLQMRNIDVVDRDFIFENLFGIVMCGLQLLFMLGLFCSLYRIR